MAFPSAWPRLSTLHKSLKIQVLPAPPRLNYLFKQIEKIATQLVKISLLRNGVGKKAWITWQKLVFLRQVSLISGVLKKMVANFWFLFIFMEVLFKGKVVGNKSIYIFYTLTINAIL